MLSGQHKIMPESWTLIFGWVNYLLLLLRRVLCVFHWQITSQEPLLSHFSYKLVSLRNDQWFSFVEQFVLTGKISTHLELESISRYIWFESHSQQLHSLMYFIKSGVGRGIWEWKNWDGFQGREWLFILWLRSSTGKEKQEGPETGLADLKVLLQSTFFTSNCEK